MMDTLKKVISKFPSKKIMVVGDIMIDKYVWGRVDRISQEAPVQIVEVLKETQVPGGAANVANNLGSLGASVFLIGVIGKDNSKQGLIYNLKKNKIGCSLIEDERPTTKKIRIMGHKQQLLRIDYETKQKISQNIEKKVMINLKKQLKNYEAIIISDYAKGMITRTLVESVVQLCREQGKKVFVDPGGSDPRTYIGVDYITPNTKEAQMLSKKEIKSEQDLLFVGNYLVGETKSNILITKGEKGMTMFEKNHNRIINMPTKAKQVVDVTGAGDTVISAFALAMCSGANSKDAMIIANHAAGLSIGKVGTSIITIEELNRNIEEFN